MSNRVATNSVRANPAKTTKATSEAPTSTHPRATKIVYPASSEAFAALVTPINKKEARNFLKSSVAIGTGAQVVAQATKSLRHDGELIPLFKFSRKRSNLKIREIIATVVTLNLNKGSEKNEQL